MTLFDRTTILSNQAHCRRGAALLRDLRRSQKKTTNASLEISVGSENAGHVLFVRLFGEHECFISRPHDAVVPIHFQTYLSDLLDDSADKCWLGERDICVPCMAALYHILAIQFSLTTMVGHDARQVEIKNQLPQSWVNSSPESFRVKVQLLKVLSPREHPRSCLHFVKVQLEPLLPFGSPFSFSWVAVDPCLLAPHDAIEGGIAKSIQLLFPFRVCPLSSCVSFQVWRLVARGLAFPFVFTSTL